MLLTAILLGGTLASAVSAQTAGAPAPKSAAQAGAPIRYHANHVPKRAGEYYGLIWGVDSLTVKAVESGELIRFSYHVLDPDKAKLMNDKNTDAFLNAPEHQIQLVIPSLEKVGKLRQTAQSRIGQVLLDGVLEPAQDGEARRSCQHCYWAFSRRWTGGGIISPPFRMCPRKPRY